jgi:hypothetical protein
VPEAYEVKPNEKVEMGEERIVTFDSKDEPDIEVAVADVEIGFDLARLKDALSAQGITRLKSEDLTIDDRPGKLFRGKKGGQQVVVAAVLDDAILVTVTTGLAEGQNEDDFSDVLDSLDLDG